MKCTFPVYITLDAPTEERGRELLRGMLESEKILRISYNISRAICVDCPPQPDPTQKGASSGHQGNP